MSKKQDLNIAGGILMFPNDLPTCLLNNTKGVQVGNFREIRFPVYIVKTTVLS